jgi:carboxyvinyl-carboxyphosphonate phosphorylmutase
MTFTERRQRFRAILAGTQCVHPGSVFDPISARIAEDLGFEIGMLAGSIASFTVLGAPDLVVLTLTEFADQIRRITRAGALPLLVDADHGYGNALNVMRTVQELEAAGVAALTIEDTLLPRAYGDGHTELLTMEEGLGKVRAALAARSDPALVIVARTSAVSVTGLDDAVERARRYAHAGADALFLTGVSAPGQLEAIRREAKLPIMLGGTDGSLGGREAMAALGVRVALQGHAPFLAAVRAVHETLKALRDGTPPQQLTNQPSAELMRQVTRDAAYAGAIHNFLGGKP